MSDNDNSIPGLLIIGGIILALFGVKGWGWLIAIGLLCL